MDTKPLLQDRPPAYNTVPAAYDYGSVPAAGFQPPAPPPYQGFPAATSGYPAAPAPPAAIATQPAYTSTYTIVQPSVVVVGGCPACRVRERVTSHHESLSRHAEFTLNFGSCARSVQFRSACWRRISPVWESCVPYSSFLWEFSSAWPCVRGDVQTVEPLSARGTKTLSASF
uniref:Brain protein I3 n=1 Tax=Cyprinus carpio carpio TaxID=630221 RepID=A0A8C1BK76_CYPCA